MKLLNVEMIDKGQGWFQVEVEIKKEGLRIPALVNFKKENNEYVMNQTGWIARYDIDSDELKTMILNHKNVRLISLF